MARSDISPKNKPIKIPIDGESLAENLHVKPAGSDFEFIASQAMTMAVINGLNTLSREGYERFAEYHEGKISMGEYATDVLKKGAVSAATSGVKTVASLYVREGIEEIAKRMGKQSFRRFANSYAGTAVAFGIVDQGYDTFRWVGGYLTDREYKVSTVQNAGATGGAIGGAAIGAVVGSFIPFLGTGIGAILGGMIGGYGGASKGKEWGEEIFESEHEPEVASEASAEEEE